MKPVAGKTKYLVGLLLAGGLIVGVAALASGRLRGRYPFIGRRDRTGESRSLAFAPSPGGQDGAPRAATADEMPEHRRPVSLEEIEGIAPADAEKLQTLGLRTTDDLLRAGASPKGRDNLAAATGISSKLILRWVNLADLFRVRGVGEEYADLLEAAGVDTVPELAQRRADHLTYKMAEVNDQKNLVRRLPAEDQVAGWIEFAKGLERVVVY